MAAPNPYREALAWIEAHPGTGSAHSLAKLILSLWNDDCSFAFSECIANLDEPRTALAIRMATYFGNYGEDDVLRDVGRAVCDRYPRLWDAGQAMQQARRALRERWDAADAQEGD